MEAKTKARLACGWMWSWFVLVTLATLYVYCEAFDLLVALVPDTSSLANAMKTKAEHWIGVALKWVGWSLFWWRAVKVLVLHGAPVPFWMEVESGRQDNNGASGRLVTIVHIGDDYIPNPNGEFWFGAVFRAHQGSDKLMRSRLALLVLAFPKCSLVIEESRWLTLKHNHEDRAEYFRTRADTYRKHTEGMAPGAFRREVAKSTKAIAKYFTRQHEEKQIDGLKWRWIIGGRGSVRDEFNHRLQFVRLEGDTYQVSKVKGTPDGTKTVHSIDELRQLAQEELVPVTS